jgi:hypothetical protein
MRFATSLLAAFCSGTIFLSTSGKADGRGLVWDFLDKNLPANGEYRGTDENGKMCSVTVHRFLVPIVVTVKGVDVGGDSHILGEFGFNYIDSTLKKIAITESSYQILIANNAAGNNEPPTYVYGTLSMQKKGEFLTQYSVGTDISKPDSPLVSCSIPNK